MDGFFFTIPFIDLYFPFLDLQDDTLNSNGGAGDYKRDSCRERLQVTEQDVL